MARYRRLLNSMGVAASLAAPAAFTSAFAAFPLSVSAQSSETTTVTALAAAVLAAGATLPSGPGSFTHHDEGLAGTAKANTGVVPSVWSFYIGLGSGGAGSSASFSTTAGDGSGGGTPAFGLSFNGSGPAEGDFTVRHDDEAPIAVPLPGSLGMLAGALALMGLFTARRAVHAKSTS